MAVRAMILSEYANESNLDMLKVFKMILPHDIGEIDAGDTFAYGIVNWQETAEKEKKPQKEYLEYYQMTKLIS